MTSGLRQYITGYTVTMCDVIQSDVGLHRQLHHNLLLLSFRCLVTVNVMWLFLTVPWVGLQCVIVLSPDHTHLLF